MLVRYGIGADAGADAGAGDACCGRCWCLLFLPQVFKIVFQAGTTAHLLWGKNRVLFLAVLTSLEGKRWLLTKFRGFRKCVVVCV